MTTSNLMITVSVCESNPISQKSYDDLMEQVAPCLLPCTCSCRGSLIRYGSYRRHIKTDGSKFPLRIQRVLCRSCGRSHALLTSAMVPYSQIPLEDQVSAAQAFEEGTDPSAILLANPELDDRAPFKLVRIYPDFCRKNEQKMAVSPVFMLVCGLVILSFFHGDFSTFLYPPKSF